MQQDGFRATIVDLRTIYDMDDIDYRNRHIPEEVAPYTKEIFRSLRNNEGRFLPKAGYMS